jgi:CDP-glucose 4,6-dehydratase
MTRDFWKGRRVLLTGHTGFKGAWLSLWLADMGAEVTGYALAPPTVPSLFEAARVAALVRDVRGDVRDLGALTAAMAGAGPEVVIHMAAQALVRESYRAPLETFEVNAMGTANLLEAARGCPSARAVLVVTTDKVYENRELDRGYREDEPLGGHDPYSSSKACAEIVAASYRRSFFSDAGRTLVATARAGNVLGGGDWAADRLVPDFVRAVERGAKLRLRSPESTRPWQHVLEPLSGYLALCEALADGDARCACGFNFGPRSDDARTVRWIARTLTELWEGAPGYEVDGGEHPHEARHLELDVSKARDQLGWSPRWDLRTALRHAVGWHRGFGAGRSADELCLTQIRAYEGDTAADETP